MVQGVRRTLGGRDLAAAAATTTYFAGIAVVPWLLLGAWTLTWWSGPEAALDRLLALRVLVPDDMGARPAYDVLVRAGAGVGPLGALVLLFPASFYGEGLRRACLALAPQDDRWTGWRARVAMTLTAVAVPALAAAYVGVGGWLRPLSPGGGGGGAADLLVRVLVGFTTTWLVLSVVLTWLFLTVAPGRPRWWVAVVGGLATGSFLAGFLQGFWLFLSLPVDVGLPFAGIGVVGGVVAVGLWLYVLHVFLLVGWAATRSLHDRVEAHRVGVA
ncbi:membrane protein [Nocardioides scoriae]|uniref:Membrane protein n=1 Tax=Nocardioides scoriae TaxID=642780 RepID=A0A1H1NPW8_9ACTN|nr:YhjD/YihY/BrkB family envelope integrity protein [Nocardioides scoriae]SDS00953.1 membrane protein [Nocardioides scoriae]